MSCVAVRSKTKETCFLRILPCSVRCAVRRRAVRKKKFVTTSFLLLLVRHLLLVAMHLFLVAYIYICFCCDYMKFLLQKGVSAARVTKEFLQKVICFCAGFNMFGKTE